MAKTYRVTFFVRFSNAMVKGLLRAGMRLGPMVLLTVRGRKSGVPHTTPVALVEYEGQRLLAAPFGNVNWVRNLRAAGEAVLTRGRRSEIIKAVELSPDKAAPVLKHLLQGSGASAFTRSYFDLTPDAPLEEFERQAPLHPIFQIQHVTYT